ncbi:type IV pilus modification PilV family protein [Paenibacillus pinistramenti]|uniref:type IV pilus modification PilV family protein n=1 Tax=Paenibacillus pinistramenti TaxID=1768003 RepID=UPI001108ADA4|nr:type II secretion system protein [Paenibacillus pinistramenti]
MPWKKHTDKPAFRRSGQPLEQGFTLIEVLASIVILAIVSLVLTSFFTHALSYSKANQNKTIMVNLARNALFYAEKQDFDKWETYFKAAEAEDKSNDHSEIACKPSADGNEAALCSEYANLVDDTSVLKAVLFPTINQIHYEISIQFQRDTYNRMLNGTANSEQDQAGQSAIDKDIAPYLLPVQVVVRDTSDTSGAKQTVVEGYITDEKIR